MSAILLPSYWRKQPKSLFSVNNAHPLARGLVFLLEPPTRKSMSFIDVSGRSGNATNEYTDTDYQRTRVSTSAKYGGSIQGIGSIEPSTEIHFPTAALNAAFSASGQATFFGILQSTLQDAGGDTSGFLLKVAGDAEHYPFTDGKIYSGAFTNSRWVNGATPPSLITEPHSIAYTAKNGEQKAYYNGASLASGSVAVAPSMASGRFASGTAYSNLPNGYFFYAAFWDRVLSPQEIAELDRNPWALFRKTPQNFYFPSAGGGGATITGSGTPTAQASTVSGTAERSVTGSGTPTAQASTVAGVAERVITSSGALASQSSAVAGSGSVGNAISGSGTLLAQSSQVAGTAERSVTGSGTPASQSATVSGAAERIVTGTGTPTSQSSTVSGTGQVGNVVTGSGSPTAQSATVSGTAERTVTSSGALSAQSSTVAGTAERTITGSGALSAQSSTVYGFDSAPVVPDTGGGGSRTVAFSSRKLRQELEEWEQKNQEKERLKRLMREDEELVLIMLALAA